MGFGRERPDPLDPSVLQRAEVEAPVETTIEDDEPIELDTDVTMQPTRRRMRFS